MLTTVLVLATIAFFVGLVGLIAKLSGRAYPGQVTCSLRNEIDYDDPYPGWGNRLFGLNSSYERKLEQPPVVAFDRWETSRSQ